ncbi:putative integral membrane protein [Actinacidiphila reveromycinica]|uniref:Putative integral membrane protein n=1 Tax=Actinacidiphila reveromycinica TaxID=659352 RepID=A0A7U3VNV8_9ACTN|nr:M56 family metallopeptidase [Streptomyces sp. SN-593]BBA98045.1 putative integral membrane protein [Streptomyces sp. SN-593]
MNVAVWLPLLLPLPAAPAARRLAAGLPPRAAAWLLACSAVLLAGSSTAALGLLAGAGALRLPPVAALGHLVLPVVGDQVTVPAACAAAALLAVVAVALLRAVRRHVLLAARARRDADRHGAAAGDLTVVSDARPDAYALPGRFGRPGRIVVTSGMLRALDPAEREALLAHERAHLAGRHHRFLTVLALACACHPALRVLRVPLSYALERGADEAAAAAVGDRRVAARAIGRAALAGHGGGVRPHAALSAAAGPVPMRVAALLAPRVVRVPRAVALALAGAVVLSAGCAVHAAYDLHGTIEVAQGEPR